MLQLGVVKPVIGASGGGQGGGGGVKSVRVKRLLNWWSEGSRDWGSSETVRGGNIDGG